MTESLRGFDEAGKYLLAQNSCFAAVCSLQLGSGVSGAWRVCKCRMLWDAELASGQYFGGQFKID